MRNRAAITLEFVSSKDTSSLFADVGSFRYLLFNVWAKSYSVDIGKSTSE